MELNFMGLLILGAGILMLGLGISGNYRAFGETVSAGVKQGRRPTTPALGAAPGAAGVLKQGQK